MWESIRFFFKAIIRKAWIGILFIFLDLADIYNLIEPSLPTKWRDITMPDGWGFALFSLIILWAAFMAYHDLRKKKMDEFLKYAPEFRRDRIFRIFYELLKEGKFLKNANTDRRQRWDEEVLKTIADYCNQTFKDLYLLNTMRRNSIVTPLEDIHFEKALREIEKLIDHDFSRFIK